MITNSRRAFLRASCASVAMLAVAGCQPGSTTTPAQIIGYASSVVTGLLGGLRQLTAAYPGLLPEATLNQIVQDLQLAEAAAQQLSTTLPPASAAATIKVVLDNVNAVLAVLAGPPLNGLIPSPFNMIVGTAAILLPILEGFVVQYLPAASVSASPAMLKVREALGKPAAGMSPAEAEAVLRAAAKLPS